MTRVCVDAAGSLLYTSNEPCRSHEPIHPVAEGILRWRSQGVGGRVFARIMKLPGKHTAAALVGP